MKKDYYCYKWPFHLRGSLSAMQYGSTLTSLAKGKSAQQ